VDLKVKYAEALEHHESILVYRPLLSLEEARKNKVKPHWSMLSEYTAEGVLADVESAISGFAPGISSGYSAGYSAEKSGNIITLNYYPIERLIPHLDWTSFVQTWDLAVNTYPSAYNRPSRNKEKEVLEKLLDDAKILLKRITENGILTLRGVIGFFHAYSEGDDIVLPNEGIRFCFPRNQEKKIYGSPNPCLADFISPGELFGVTTNPAGLVGFFALSAGFGLREAEAEYRNRSDDYRALLLAGLANSLAEAFSMEVHSRLKTLWGGSGIRPAFGFPACPDHKDKETVFKILEAKEHCGLELTEAAMIIPTASVCGMYMAHPDSFYFGSGRLGDDQLSDWANRKGITFEEAGKRLGRF
jgi:5-methyltetrahydrofolate--homocysteine methyltransferase